MGSISYSPTGRCRLALLLLTSLWLLPLASAAAAAADQVPGQIVGNWLTEMHDGIIGLSMAADGSLQGRIMGGNGPQRLDQHNPAESRRSQPLLGQIIISDLKYDGEGKWSGGTIYDPDSGHTYRCRMELLDSGRLQVRGFLGFALLGRSQQWTRYLGSDMTPPPAPR